MCLIAFSKNGAALAPDIFSTAQWHNPDGVGVMSRYGVEKFLGRRAGKRTRRYLKTLPPGTPFAVHFRYATHGEVCAYLTHPFRIPGQDTYVMHNGIIHKTAKFAKKGHVSDTSLFVSWYMKDFVPPSDPGHRECLEKLEKDLSWSNKMVIYHRDTDSWTIANEAEGLWSDGFWYSNEYSLPFRLQTPRPTIGKAYGYYDRLDDYWDKLSPETRKVIESWRNRESAGKALVKSDAPLPSGPCMPGVADDVAENGEMFLG